VVLQLEITPEAMRTFRQLRPNEALQIRKALGVIKENPEGTTPEYQMLSQQAKYSMYRYRTNVGFVVYHISQGDIVIRVNTLLMFRK
jgi:mRNA-degrading endonuclease RelE of RelBE toxin-antitoxin system